MPRIQQDNIVRDVMQSRGIADSVGSFGAHKVRIGNNPPVSLKKIKRFAIPYQGFRTATKIERGRRGIADTAGRMAQALTRQGGVDAPNLLKGLKTLLAYESRLAALGQPHRKGGDFRETFMAMRNGMDEETRTQVARALLSDDIQVLGLSLARECASLTHDADLKRMLHILSTMKSVFCGRGALTQAASNFCAVIRQQGGLKPRRLLRRFLELHECARQLASLGLISKKDTANYLRALAPAVENLSNTALAEIWQAFNTADMDEIRSSFMRPHSPKSNRRAAEALFDLQGLLLKEISNRMPGQGNPQTLSRQFGAEPAEAREHRADIAPASLTAIAEASSRGATSLANDESLRAERIGRRGLAMPPHAVGDMLRKSELTIAVRPDVLLGENGILARPGNPKENIFHLAERGVKPRGDGYLMVRDQVEKMYFPGFSGQDVRPDERPAYATLNTSGLKIGDASSSYGSCTLVLKKSVARRATYTASDTFHTLKMSVTAESIKAFHALVESEWPGMVAQLKAKLPKEQAAGIDRILAEAAHPSAPGSRFRATIDRLLDGVRFSPSPVSSRFVTTNFNVTGNTDLDSILQTLALRCFFPQEGSQKALASYDSLETLLDDMNELEHGQILYGVQKGMDGERPVTKLGGNYIEAQIHGPLIPERDIEEIRIFEREVAPEELAELKRRTVEFSRQTGVKVTFISDKEFAAEESVGYDLDTASTAFSNAHLDPQERKESTKHLIDQFEERFLATLEKELSKKGRADFMQKFFPKPSSVPKSLIDRYAGELERSIEDEFKASGGGSASEAIIGRADSMAMENVVLSTVSRLVAISQLENLSAERLDLLKSLALEGKGLPSAAGLASVHARASSLAETLAGIASRPHSTAEILGILSTFVLSPGNDEARSRALAVRYLSAATPPLLDENARRDVLGKLSDPALLRQISIMMNATQGLPPDSPLRTVASLGSSLERIIRELHSAEGVKFEFHRDRMLDIRFLGAEVRDRLANILPAAKDALQGLPPFPPTPAPANPAALPSDTSARRSFLVRMLDAYIPHEQGFDKREHVHGRGHISRAFILGTALAGVMEEHGVPVDRNLLLCSIAGHDSGRTENGNDTKEPQSAEKTLGTMSSVFGEDALGEDFGTAVKDCIVSPKKGQPFATLEAMLLHAADSLDIGRVGRYDVNRNPFLVLNAQGSRNPEATALLRRLYEEADKLQKLTNPSCRLNPEIIALNERWGETDDDEGIREQLAQVRARMAKEFAEETKLSSEDFFSGIEKTLRGNRNLFPLLSKYYFAEEDAAIDAAADRIRADLNGLISTKFNIEGMFPAGTEPLVGRARTDFENVLRDNIAKLKSNPGDLTDPEAIARKAFDDAFASLFASKVPLLQKLKELPFNNEEQRIEFRNWIMNARAIKGTEDLEMVHRTSFVLSSMLREFLAHPPLTPSGLFRLLADFEHAADEHVRLFVSQAFTEKPEPDFFFAEFLRMASCAFSLLSAGNPPIIPRESLDQLLDLMDSDAFRKDAGILSNLPVVGLGTEDASVLNSIADRIVVMATEFCGRAERRWRAGDERDVANLSPEMKDYLLATTPESAAKLGLRK